MRGRPLIGVISDRRAIGAHRFHVVGEKYLLALVDGSGALPVSIPVLEDGVDVEGLLERFDGLFLTGSPSNVEPHHYLGHPSKEGTWHDPERDDAAFALIPATIKVGMPLFAVCRGFQEMNVVFGGSLHQLVHEVPGYLMHREDSEKSLDEQYGPSHSVEFTAGGLLGEITGENRAMVNSLHWQAVDRLGEGLRVEAVAEDGLIEAFVVEDTPGFNLSVQWHPEWKVMETPVSLAIFQAFGDACRDFHSNS